jgi:hypothetical protein
MLDDKPTLDYATPTSPQRQANSVVKLAKFITGMLMLSAIAAAWLGAATGLTPLTFGAGVCLALAILIAVSTMAVGLALSLFCSKRFPDGIF